MRNRGRSRIQCVTGKTGRSLVACHEFLTLVPRHNCVDIVELATTPVIHKVQQAKRPCPAIAEYNL